MTRIIDADELKKTLESKCDICPDKNTSWCKHVCFYNDIEYLIDNAPTVDERQLGMTTQNLNKVIVDAYQKGLNERPQGEWIYNQYDGNPNIGNWHCSICHYICCEMRLAHDNYNFCPNCGAGMEVKNNDT